MMEPLTVSSKAETFLWINKHGGNLKSQEHCNIVKSYITKSRRSNIYHPKGYVCQPQSSRTVQTQVSRTSTRPPLFAVLLDPIDTALSTSTTRSIARLPHEPSHHVIPNFMRAPLSSPFTKQLDPFFDLPCHIPHHDKSLLQYYLTAMQEPVHGHRGDAKSCPIRPRTIICLQSDKTFLQWVILTTELYLLQGKSAPADESQVLGRKTYIYKLMSKAIADPTTRYSDNTLSVVAAAGIGETLLGNLAQGRKHLVALRLLIQRRGGSRILKDMVFGQALIITMSCIFTGTCEDTFPNKKSLREAVQSFFGTFHAMQEWNQNLRVEFEEPPSDNQDLQRYRSSRGKAFGMTSALQKYIQPLRNTTIPSERRFNLVVLW